jgi:hypothetical protein
MKRLIAVFLAFCVGVLPALSKDAYEPVVPLGNWNKVESLVKNTAILVSLKTGNKAEGSFLGLDANAIRLVVDGKELALPKESVAEIRYAGVKGHMASDIAFGAIAGFVGGLLVGAGVYKAGGNGAASGGAFVGAFAGGIGLGYVAGKHSEGGGLIYRSADQGGK